MEKEKIKNIIIAVLGIMVILLIIGLMAYVFKYEYLNDKYDDLNDHYEYLMEVNKNNGNNQNNESDVNNSDNSIDNKKNKTQDEILTIVLKDLKITKDKISDLDIDLEYKVRYGKNVYEVSFNYNYFEYEYYLDPVSGKILDSFKSID